MAQIRWTLKAAGDLCDIEAYIARDSALYAVNFIDRLVKATEKLQQAPRLGRTVPDSTVPIFARSSFEGTGLSIS